MVNGMNVTATRTSPSRSSRLSAAANKGETASVAAVVIAPTVRISRQPTCCWEPPDATCRARTTCVAAIAVPPSSRMTARAPNTPNCSGPSSRETTTIWSIAMIWDTRSPAPTIAVPCTEIPLRDDARESGCSGGGAGAPWAVTGTSSPIVGLRGLRADRRGEELWVVGMELGGPACTRPAPSFPQPRPSSCRDAAPRFIDRSEDDGWSLCTSMAITLLPVRRADTGMVTDRHFFSESPETNVLARVE